MNNKLSVTNPETNKHREIIKQQLRAMTDLKSAASSNKLLSADSMIEDLLSKKEIFQRKDSKPPQTSLAWLTPGSGSVHPLYERVWAGVQSNMPHLADTQRLSTLLMTSGLSTDVLGFIWSLANHTVVGALTQQELYVVLALVALAQSGYAITNTAVLNQLPQPPLPKLDLTIICLPTISIATPSLSASTVNACVTQQTSTTTLSIAPLSASNLLETTPINHITIPPSLINQTNVIGTDNVVSTAPQTHKEIGISYLSNPQVLQPQVSFMGVQKNLPSLENQKNSFSSAPEVTVSQKIDEDGLSSKLNILTIQNNDTKLNVSFDDDFTDFQTADFKMQKEQNPVNLDDDEFTNFQSVSVNLDLLNKSNDKDNKQDTEKDQTAPTSSLGKVPDFHTGTSNNSMSFVGLEKPLFFPDKCVETPKQSKNEQTLYVSKPNMDTKNQEKVLVNEINTVSSSEDKYSVFATLSNENEMNFSNFIRDKHTEGVKESNTSGLDLPQIKPFDNAASEDDDDYSDFHSFDFTIAADIKTETKEKDLSYSSQPHPDINTLSGFKNESSEFHTLQKHVESVNVADNKPFDAQFDLFQQNINFESFNDLSVSEPSKEFANFENDMFSKNVDDMKIVSEEIETFSDFMSVEFQSVESTEDKYSALRVLEPVTEDASDDFGEFIEANTVNTFVNKPVDETVQIRCLDACLTLLQAGVSHLSAASSPKVLSEVLSDPRTSQYLDCLQEVNKVSERILHNIDISIVEKQKTDLEAVREQLTPYFANCQYSAMEETKGSVCGLCHSDTGPCPVKYGLCTFHAPCANLYLHCVDTVLPNITSVK